MFTGIIEQLGRIDALELLDSGIRMAIASEFDDLSIGESVAIDGVCLTVTAQRPGMFSCDISPETMAVTAFSNLKEGDGLHLERALRVGDRLSGHWVLGHVDACLRLDVVKQIGEFTEMIFSGIAPQHQAYLVPKGSVCLAGVSLTVNQCEADTFSIMCIPQTLALTKLGKLPVGAQVNVEYDYLAKLTLNKEQL